MDATIRLDHMIAENSPITRLSDVIRKFDGLFPTELVDRLGELGLPTAHLLSLDASTTRDNSPKVTPEPHVLDLEWYFTDRTSRRIAGRIAPEDRVALLGAPSLMQWMRPRSATLFDKSQYVEQRFASARHHSIRKADLNRTPISGCFDTVVLDPPWYFDVMKRWLSLAASVVRPGGLIYMPLLGGLTRPTADNDRAELINLAINYGNVSLESKVVEYAVPLFEERALRTRGIMLAEPWRVADLLIIADCSTISNDVEPALPDGEAVWSTLRIADQIVKYRNTKTPRAVEEPVLMGGASVSEGSAVISRVSGFRSWDYSSVSTRDSARRRIHLWTSRNRVAQINDQDRLLNVLNAVRDIVNNCEPIPLHSISGQIDVPAADVESVLEFLEIGEKNEQHAYPAI